MNWQSIIDKFIGDRQLLWWLLCSAVFLGLPGRTVTVYPDGRTEVKWAISGGLVGAAWLAAKASWENSQKIGRLEELIRDFITRFDKHCDRVEDALGNGGSGPLSRANLDGPKSQRLSSPAPQNGALSASQ